ncbi:uncharacterized protein J4E88_010118 [Alternaria novae-zelandiae]|uniref:uncharacterized protein n=1 Tax=Alternaria novae-zelandiae TaxID=430562 RepID=UPI0020C408C8|nr:uncharacterized protein J4E88_010118 [Alternaria novae-zelandiae]KAI4667717.1 hypothetical protein J4E88_010118 [Alternaria novae-zelandiae]
MTSKTLELSDIFESAWETICASLPRLLLVKNGGKGTTKSSMRHMFEGHLGEWNIQDELEDFLAAIKPSFDNCPAMTNVNTPVILVYHPDFVADEGVTMAAEIDVDGRIKQNLATPVRTVLHALARCRSEADAMLLPIHIECSSSKGEDVKSRPKDQEPDLILNVSDSNGGDETVRIIGEFKMCTTHNLAKMIKDPASKNPGSLRNLLGQPAKYMYKHKIKYGFVSTYNETIFLRIEPRKSNPEEYGLYYSPVFRYDTPTCVDEGNNVHTFGTRFTTLFMLHKVVDDGGEGWRLKASDIPKQDDWYSRTVAANTPSAAVGSPYLGKTPPLPSKSPPLPSKSMIRRLRSRNQLSNVLTPIKESPMKAANAIKKTVKGLKDNLKRSRAQNTKNSPSPKPRSPRKVSWAKTPPQSAENSEVTESARSLEVADIDDGDDSEYIDDGFDPSDDTDGPDEFDEAGAQAENLVRLRRLDPSTPTPMSRR